MIIEQPIDSDCLAVFGIVEILSDMGWQNILYFGRSACLPLIDLMYASISLASSHPCSIKITHWRQAILVIPALISDLLDVPFANEQDNPFNSHLTKEKCLQVTHFLCSQQVVWRQGNYLPIADVYPSFGLLHHVLHCIFILEEETKLNSLLLWQKSSFELYLFSVSHSSSNHFLQTIWGDRVLIHLLP